MSYTVNLEGFDGQNIEVKSSFWTGAKLLVNGNLAPKGAQRGEMLLQRNDGRQVTATFKPQAFGLDVPQLVVDGNIIHIAPPLKWFQWVWSALPILLVFLGGLLGGVIGIIAFSINTAVFRSKTNEILKFVITAIVSIVAVIVDLVLAAIITTLLNG